MAIIVLEGRKLNSRNVKRAIYARATKELQGVCAIVTKKLDCSTAKVFLFNDNGRNLFEEDGKILNFVCSEFSSVVV